MKSKTEPALLPRIVLASIAVFLCGLTAAGVQDARPQGAETSRLETSSDQPDVPAYVDNEFRPGGSDYKIGRQDLIEIRVFGLEELSQTVRVSDDGSISLPLLGRLEVAGLDKIGLQNLIARLLEERFVPDPQVTIFVKEYESRKVAVSGAVKRPGSYEMLGTKTLLEMISMAGGLDENYGDEIVLFRADENGPTRRISVDLDGLVYDADPELNLVLLAGDIIYVPVVKRIRIFVGGAVRVPSLYQVPRDEPVTVLKAITLAGGTTDRAAEKKIQIIRNDEGGRRVSFIVNLMKIRRGNAEDPILLPDDVVFVPEAAF